MLPSSEGGWLSKTKVMNVTEGESQMELQIKLIEAFIPELVAITDTQKKHELLLLQPRGKKIVEALAFLEKASPLQFERLKDMIVDAFSSHKRAVKADLKEAIKSVSLTKTKNTMSEITGVKYDDLETFKNGEIVPTIDNYAKILEQGKDTQLVWDTMSGRPYLTRMGWTPLTAPLQIKDTSGVASEYHYYDEFNKTGLRRHLNKIFVSEITWSQLDAAVNLVAKTNQTDFYKEWMESAEGKWDGVDRFGVISNISEPKPTPWAIKLLKPKMETLDDVRWAVAFGRVLMLALVTRCFEPGYHLRYSFALEGKQNIGKTRFCQTLVPPQWYVSASLLEAKEHQAEYLRATYNKAVVEFAELGGTDKASINAWKRIQSEYESVFRPLYKDDTVSFPKRSINIITTNEEHGWLRDPTGATRTVPIRSELNENEVMDFEWFEQNKLQIISQAIQMYRNGQRPIFTEDELKLQKEQTELREDRYDTVEYDVVQRYLDLHGEDARTNGVYVEQLYEMMSEQGDHIPISAKYAMSRRFGTALRDHGFVRPLKATHVDGAKRKVWLPPK